MAALPDVLPTRPNWLIRLAASRRFQSFAARVPGLRHIARAEGAALFDLVAGFVNSQTLMALVELRILHLMFDGPLSVSQVAGFCDVPQDRMQVLLQACAALSLLKRRLDVFALCDFRTDPATAIGRQITELIAARVQYSNGRRVMAIARLADQLHRLAWQAHGNFEQSVAAILVWMDAADDGKAHVGTGHGFKLSGWAE